MGEERGGCLDASCDSRCWQRGGEDDVMTGDKTHHFDLLLPGQSWTERDTCLSWDPATASGSVRYT